MKTARYHHLRGQVLPFWSTAIVTTLLLLSYLFNYGNMLQWQIAAQTAADSAATAAISTDANVFNEMSMLLYTAAIEEYRVRYLNQGMLNILNPTIDPDQIAAGDGNYQPGSAWASAPACRRRENCGVVYNYYEGDITDAVDELHDTVTRLRQLDALGITQGGLKNSADVIGTNNGGGTNCDILDCRFYIKTVVDNNTVETIACGRLPNIFPMFPPVTIEAHSHAQMVVHYQNMVWGQDAENLFPALQQIPPPVQTGIFQGSEGGLFNFQPGGGSDGTEDPISNWINYKGVQTNDNFYHLIRYSLLDEYIPWYTVGWLPTVAQTPPLPGNGSGCKQL